MDKELLHGLMEKNMLVSLKKVKETDKELLHGLAEQNMLVSLKMAKCMVMEY